MSSITSSFTANLTNLGLTSGQAKFFKDHKRIFSPLCFSYVETGSKKHPVTGYVFATTFKEREYKDWCKKYDPNYVVEQEEDEND